MTIKELRMYRFICAEIAQKEKRLKEDKIHVVDAVQTAAEFPYWKHTIPIEGDVYPYDPRPIRGLILRRRSEKARIEQYVMNISDYLVQRAIEEKYILFQSEPVSWDDVAMSIGYMGSGNALKQAVWKYVQRNP